MSISSVAVYGPTQDTSNTTTVAYTLGVGEAVSVGQGVCLYVSAAGSATAVAASAADSKGNTYTVAAGVAPSGSVAASIVYCSNVQFALVATDVITVTLSHACTDKQIIVERVSSQDTSDMVEIKAIGSLGGSGSTAPLGTSGTQATTVAASLARRVLTWNGNSSLTLDATWTSLYSGHFDNGGASQTKQQSLAGKTLAATTTVSCTDTLSGSQPWAEVLVTLKSNTSPPVSTAKAAARGLSTRDGDRPPSGYDASYSNRMIDVVWSVIQPVDPSTQGTPALAAAELARIDTLIDAAVASGDTVTFRIFAGNQCPSWLKSKVGTFNYADTAGSPPYQVVHVPVFWVQAYWDAYDTFQSLLGSRYDGGSSPTARQAAVRGVQQALGMTVFAEPFQRHTNSQANRSEMVGGGSGWTGADSSGRGGVPVAVPGARFSFAADLATQKKNVDIHATRWPNTCMHISFNPWQILYSEAEAGFSYTGGNQKSLGSDDSTISNTKTMIDYMISKLGASNRVVLENNSVRRSFFNSDGTLSNSNAKMKLLYQYFLAKPFARYYQCANSSNLGAGSSPTPTEVNFVMKYTAATLLANACEPTTNLDGTNYPVSVRTGWDTALKANALPTGGTTAHIPTCTTIPAIAVPAAGYTPTTVLTADLGAWDAGSNAISGWHITWYRRNVTTGALSIVRGPTAKSTSTATDSYTIVNGDLDNELLVGVTATNTDGTSGETQSAFTPVIATPATGVPVNTTLPSITPASPVVGDVVTADHGAWTNNPTDYTYAFTTSTDGVNWSLVQSGALASYLVQPGDAGAQLEVTVTASNGQDGAPATSAATQTVRARPVITLDQPSADVTYVDIGISTYLFFGTVTPRGANTTISAMTINGVAVTVASDGRFSYSVPLTVGLNTVTLIATDNLGTTGTTSTIVYRGAGDFSIDVADVQLRIHQRSLA